MWQVMPRSTGLGAVLSHSVPDRTEWLITVASHTLNPAEQIYSQIDKEALGIVWSLKKFHTYLNGRCSGVLSHSQGVKI